MRFFKYRSRKSLLFLIEDIRKKISELYDFTEMATRLGLARLDEVTQEYELYSNTWDMLDDVESRLLDGANPSLYRKSLLEIHSTLERELTSISKARNSFKSRFLSSNQA